MVKMDSLLPSASFPLLMAASASASKVRESLVSCGEKFVYDCEAKVWVFFACRIVLSSPEMLKHPFSITLFGDWMYWSDWDRNAIFQADKFNGQRASLVANSSMVSLTQ